MLFTWMLAMQLWNNREDVIDPLREDNDDSNVVKLTPTMPKEPKALVA